MIHDYSTKSNALIGCTTIYILNGKTPNLVKIGKKIREMRKLKGFLQENLVAEAQLGRTYYGRVERGEQSNLIRQLVIIFKMTSRRNY